MTRQVGAKTKNQNARKHGFYSELNQEGRNGSKPTLENEISLLAGRRDAVDKWMMDRLAAGEPVEVLKYLGLLGEIGSRIARMLRMQEQGRGGGEAIADLFDEVLDVVNRQVEVEI